MISRLLGLGNEKGGFQLNMASSATYWDEIRAVYHALASHAAQRAWWRIAAPWQAMNGT